jgi:hypothetical protein
MIWRHTRISPPAGIVPPELAGTSEGGCLTAYPVGMRSFFVFPLVDIYLAGQTRPTPEEHQYHILSLKA